MKTKYTIIPKLNTLSAKEMDLFFYLVERMNQFNGYVEGVYYKDVMQVTGMCKQSFYNALKGLEKKEIVTVNKSSDVDYNVVILGNAFPDAEARKKGYVKLNRKAFRTKEFWQLKAHEKYMLLEFLKGTHENGSSIRIGVEKFYEKYQELLGVSERVIRGYLHNLRKFFSIGIKDGKYFITYLHSVFNDNCLKKKKSEEEWYREHLVKKECWRNHIEYDKESLTSTAYLSRQYFDFFNGQSEIEKIMAAAKALMLCIRTSVEDIKRKDRQLQPKYIHKLLRKSIGLPESAPKAI